MIYDIADVGVPIMAVAPFLAPEENCCTKAGRVFSLDETARFLGCFAAFSRALPELLSLADKSCVGPRYDELRAEIELNLEEENGLAGAIPPYENQSHYSIIRAEIFALFGRDPDCAEVTSETRAFLDELVRAVSLSGSGTYGALLALESTAAPEIGASHIPHPPSLFGVIGREHADAISQAWVKIGSISGCVQVVEDSEQVAQPVSDGLKSHSGHLLVPVRSL